MNPSGCNGRRNIPLPVKKATPCPPGCKDGRTSLDLNRVIKQASPQTRSSPMLNVGPQGNSVLGEIYSFSDIGDNPTGCVIVPTPKSVSRVCQVCLACHVCLVCHVCLSSGLLACPSLCVFISFCLCLLVTVCLCCFSVFPLVCLSAWLSVSVFPFLSFHIGICFSNNDDVHPRSSVLLPRLRRSQHISLGFS